MIERQILQGLLKRENISAEQLWQAFRSTGHHPDEDAAEAAFLKLLEELGVLPPEATGAHQAGPDQRTLPLPKTPGGPSQPPGIPAFRHEPITPGNLFVRRYEIRKTLGRGGMGVVYLAYDRFLKREVAVKVIENPNEKERRCFLRESSAQARVSHEHICRVYDAGEVEDRLFISMQLIRGDSLKVAAAELALPDQVRLILQVAQGMTAAHRMGLVHRDLKPGNIMVERTEGDRRAYVVDFGLVRELSEEAHSQIGEMAGTPLYMAPEQFQGKPELIDWRTDIFALGMTLYEIVAGTPLISAPTPATVMLKILSEEELRLSREASQRLPLDLQAIILKCIAKQPRDRYPSMRELADDLGRFLEGRPVSARPVPAFVRIFRWARRNRSLAAAIGTGFTMVAILSSLWLASILQAREWAILSRRFGEEVSSIERIHESSMMMPLHDTCHEYPQISERMNWIRTEMDRLGKIADGPGHYALGRGCIALSDWPAARVHFEAALRADSDDTASHFHLGLSLGELYRLSRMEIFSSGEVSGLESRLKQCRQELGEPALQHLRLGVEAAGSVREYGEALIAYNEDDYDKAIQLAEIAWRKRPLHYAAGIIQGWSLLDRGNEKLWKGNLDAAQMDLDAAGRISARLLDNARSDPEIRRLEAERRVRCLTIASKRGKYSDEIFQWATEACAELQRVISRSASAHHLKAILLSTSADAAEERGQDPIPKLEAALAEIGQALEINPDRPGYWNELAGIRLSINWSKLAQGVVDKPLIEQSLDAVHRALRLNPNLPVSLNIQGNIYRQLACVAMLEGTDQRPALRQAIAALEDAHRLAPENEEPLRNLAIVYNDLSMYEFNYGLDPRESARRALERVEDAMALGPGLPYTAVIRSNLLFVFAAFELNTGGDGAAIRRFLDTSKTAVQSNPGNYQAHLTLCQANELFARWQLRNDQAPDVAIEAALVAGRQSVVLNPGNPYCQHTLASACLAGAEWRLSLGESPGRELAEAEKNARQCLRMNPADIEMTIGMARVERGQAAAALARNRDPGPDARSALALLAEADRMDPREPRVPALQAQCWILLAAGEAKPDRKRDFAGKAVTLLREALRRNPFNREELVPHLREAEALRQTGASAPS